MTAPTVTYKTKITSKQSIENYGSDKFCFSNLMGFPHPTYTEELYGLFILGLLLLPMNIWEGFYRYQFER